MLSQSGMIFNLIFIQTYLIIINSVIFLALCKRRDHSIWIYGKFAI